METILQATVIPLALNGNLAKEFVNKKIFVLYVMHID